MLLTFLFCNFLANFDKRSSRPPKRRIEEFLKEVYYRVKKVITGEIVYSMAQNALIHHGSTLCLPNALSLDFFKPRGMPE